MKISEIDIKKWIDETEFNSYAPIVKDSGIHLSRSSDNIHQYLISIHFEERSNGTNIMMRGGHNLEDVLHLIMKKKDMRRISCAIMALMALRAENPYSETNKRYRSNWTKLIFQKLERMAATEGPSKFAFPSFVRLVKVCNDEFDKSAGLDVESAKESVKKAFLILVDKLPDSEIASMWREAKVNKVLRN